MAEPKHGDARRNLGPHVKTDMPELEGLTIMTAWKRFLTQLKSDTNAATAIEYGLIATLIAVAIVVAATAVGTQLDTTFDTIITKLGGTAP